MSQERSARSLTTEGRGGEVLAGYKGGEEMPLAGYAALLGVYNAAFAGLLLAAKQSGRGLPERAGYADLLLMGVATHKLSRIIAKDFVTSPLRAPFTEYKGSAGAGEVNEKSRGEGLRRAVGDLVSCPWCMAPWVAAGLAFGFVFRPRAITPGASRTGSRPGCPSRVNTGTRPAGRRGRRSAFSPQLTSGRPAHSVGFQFDA
ncbi:MAG: DUF1360 domain-containing protein [Acidobacteria bacterium]|nr:DUF1360 domain-containing protein [Acidobacteriota bacterium]